MLGVHTQILTNFLLSLFDTTSNDSGLDMRLSKVKYFAKLVSDKISGSTGSGIIWREGISNTGLEKSLNTFTALEKVLARLSK